jgi:pterin-4a-carbinolamine dehydratase
LLQHARHCCTAKGLAVCARIHNPVFTVTRCAARYRNVTIELYTHSVNGIRQPSALRFLAHLGVQYMHPARFFEQPSHHYLADAGLTEDDFIMAAKVTTAIHTCLEWPFYHACESCTACGAHRKYPCCPTATTPITGIYN